MKGKSLNETQKTHTKGGGVIHTVDNNVLLGPNAIEVPDREDFTTDMESIQDIVAKQKIIQDKLGMGDVITYFAGERPATYEEDFVVRRGIFTKNIIEVAGIQSPRHYDRARRCERRRKMGDYVPWKTRESQGQRKLQSET